MNILILSQMFPDRQDPVNGIFVLDQTRELQKQGHQIMVIRLVPYVPPGFGFLKRKWKHYREIPSQDCLGDITVHYIRSFFLPRGILLSWTARVAYRVIKRFLNQIHPQFEFDVIHAHAILPDGYVGGLLRRAFRRPLISTIHGTDLQQRIHQSRLWRNAIHYALLQTDQIVLVSHKLRHILEETFPDIDKSKISVIHNGIDPEKTRMSQKTEIKQEFSNRILLLSVGNLIPIKGHLYVLQAVADLKIEFPTIAYCIIGDGPERSTLENAVKHLSLQSHVSFTGFQPPHVVADYMAACDIFVLPSYNEGFGIVYIEAMSFGKPVIACRGQGIEDCITHQVNGFLVNPQDSNDLKETIRYILLHPDHTGRITKQAQDDILNNWTWAVNICHYQSLYQKLEPLTPNTAARMKKTSIGMITTVHSSIDERIYLKEAVSLVQSGYKVSIIGNHPGEETLQHVKFYPLPQTKNRIHRILFSPWHALRLARKIKADIYHFHDPELYPLASLLPILYRRPVIMDIHEHYGKDIMSKHWIPKRLRKIYCSIFTIIENLCLHNVRALIYVVPAIAERYQHVKRPKIEIRNCPILEAFTVAEDISIPRESTRAIYTGRLDPTNGILELVKAFALIRQETPHARLDIMGPKMTDEFYQILEKEINALDLENTVFLRPPVPYYEMKYELFKASIGYVTLLPTSENNSIGRPNKTYEYMACKLAVISSDFPSMRKLMDESRGGLCVDPSNPVDIAEKTSSLMKNPDYCRQLGENGYQMVQTHYCWSMESQKLVSFYHNLFSSKKTNLSQ